MPAITPDISAAAVKIQQTLADQAAGYNANQDLTAAAKQRLTAKAYVAAKSAMNDLQERWSRTAKTTVTDATTAVFGVGSAAGADALSVRDADERVLRLENASEALDLMARARTNGDRVLERAIGLRAFREAQSIFGSEWSNVVDEFTEQNPAAAQAMAEIRQAERQGIQDAWQQAYTFAVPKPSQIDTLHDAQINQLAGEQPAPTG